MTTPAAPSTLAIDLLARGVAFNPRFVRPTRIPRWPGIIGRPTDGVVIRFADGTIVIPPGRGKDDPAALRLRDVRGELLLKENGETAGTVTLVRMPPGFGETAPSRVPFASFLAPFPGLLVVDLDGGEDAAFAGGDRCRFCLPALGGPRPRVSDLAEGLARFGDTRALHFSLCCRHRLDMAPLGAALETAAAILPPVALSVEVPPGGGREGMRALAGRGVSQMIVDLDAPDAATFAARCPGRAAAVGWDLLHRQIDDALAVFGKGRVGVRMILYPEDVAGVYAVLKKVASAGAVPLLLPFSPEGGAGHDPAALKALAARLAPCCGGRILPIDPYAGFSLPIDGAALPLPWYRRLLARLGALRGRRLR